MVGSPLTAGAIAGYLPPMTVVQFIFYFVKIQIEYRGKLIY